MSLGDARVINPTDKRFYGEVLFSINTYYLLVELNLSLCAIIRFVVQIGRDSFHILPTSIRIHPLPPITVNHNHNPLKFILKPATTAH